MIRSVRYWKDTRCLVRWKLFHLESIWKNISYVKKEDWRKKIRMQLGISQDALVLVYVGRMAKEKNIEELLEYQQDAGKSGVILVLVGDGPYLPELKKKGRRAKAC